MTAVRAAVIAAPGTNRDAAAVRALQQAGADASVLPAARLVERPSLLDGFDMVVIAGGFSYADALGSGRVFALQIVRGAAGAVADGVSRLVETGRPVLGICNGFQVLTQAGLLPGALGHNSIDSVASGVFTCRWVRLAAPPATQCVWTAGIDALDCPVAHGEGRYVHADIGALSAAGQVALTYVDDSNPNGSSADIAGVCDPSGVVLGLMPHPEDHVVARQHPLSRRDPSTVTRLGSQIFQRGVAHARGL